MSAISGQLFTYLQSIQAYIAPPIAAVFLIGILWRGATAAGAAWSLAIGAVLGLSRLVLEINRESLDGIWYLMATENFLHVGFAFFTICALVLIGVSLVAPRALTAEQRALTLGGGRLEPDSQRRIDAALSAGVLALVGALWLIFS